MRWILGSLCLIGATVVSYQANAQQAVDPATRREERREERREDVRENRETRAENRELRQGTTDEQLAAVMLACCNNEVQISQFAQDHLRTQEAKDFAERMIRDHQAACDKLQKIAGHYGHDFAAAATNPPQTAALEIGKARIEITRKPGAEGDAPRGAAPAANHLDWVAIHKQVGEECLAAAKQELRTAESKQHSDECYIGHQIAGHEKMISELKVFQRYASPSLRGQIDSALETAQSHLTLAKSTMESLAKNAGK